MLTDLIYRLVKASPLTNAEVDANFNKLDVGLGKVAADFYGATDPATDATVTVVAGMTWTDTSASPIANRKRNSTNDAWIYIGPAFAQATPAKNLLINSGFSISQLSIPNPTTLAANGYGHDMFKAGSSGCTYSYSSSGGKITINITAGSLKQIVEGSLLGSGPYCASWEGTAQCSIDGGAYAASGMTATAVAGTNQTLEWGIGTLSRPKYEPGLIATPWCPYNGIYGGENQAVLRYFRRRNNAFDEYYGTGLAVGTQLIAAYYRLPVSMRVAPTITHSGIKCINSTGTTVTVNSVSVGTVTNETAELLYTMASASFVGGNATLLLAPTGALIQEDARL